MWYYILILWYYLYFGHGNTRDNSYVEPPWPVKNNSNDSMKTVESKKSDNLFIIYLKSWILNIT